MINNRQAGRRRGRGGGNNGGQRPGGNPGRPDNGNRIDNRARGNANQLYEKYKNLAAEAQRQGDRVNTEYYWQFADHYFRVLSESRSRFEEQNQRRQREESRDDQYDDGFDNDAEDYGDEGDPIRPGASRVRRISATISRATSARVATATIVRVGNPARIAAPSVPNSRSWPKRPKRCRLR